MRERGSQGLEVAEIGLGVMGMTVAYGVADEEGGIATETSSRSGSRESGGGRQSRGRRAEHLRRLLLPFRQKA
jgi:hypothetical protein